MRITPRYSRLFRSSSHDVSQIIREKIRNFHWFSGASTASWTGPSGLRNRGIWLVKTRIAQYRMLRAFCGFHAFIQSKLNSCGPGPTRCSGRGASLNPLVHRAANLQPLGQVISVMSRSFYEYLGQFSSHLKVFLAINGTANIKKCGNLLLAGAPGCLPTANFCINWRLEVSARLKEVPISSASNYAHLCGLKLSKIR